MGFSEIAIMSIFTSNIMTSVGAISLQSEKRNFIYMLVSSMCIIVSIIITGLLYYIAETFILAPLNAEYLKLFIAMLVSVLLSFASRGILKKTTKEMYYLYEKGYTFPVQSAVTIGTLLMVDFKQDFLVVLFQLAMFCVGFLLVQIIFYALYERLDSKYTLKPARNVPVMLFTLSIVSLIFYIIAMVI